MSGAAPAASAGPSSGGSDPSTTPAGSSSKPTDGLQVTAVVDFPAVPSDAASPRLRKVFGPPQRWLIARQPHEVAAVLDKAHAAARAGAWVVGAVRYEAAAAFEPAAAVHEADGPLARFAVFAPDDERPACTAVPGTDARWRFEPWQDALDADGFARDVAAIHELIRAGEVYQVNLTTRLRSRFTGQPLAAFAALQRAQPGGYAVYLDAPASDDAVAETLLSVSPELFFDWRDGRLRCQPMKGTAARCMDPQADRDAAQQLRRSEKERAENLMIVDLLRNDLSRIAQTGSVRVPALFELHALPTVWQMTSTIEARARDGLRLSDAFAALFPCGSVTGAPKLRAMHHIRRLEPQARGVYCGAVGVLAPGGAATFNVAIRTVCLGPATGDGPRAARCGIGSGITLDATAAGEAAEWQHKQRFLARAAEPFALLESMLLQDGRIWLREPHLARLRRSALAFNIALGGPAAHGASHDADGAAQRAAAEPGVHEPGIPRRGADDGRRAQPGRARGGDASGAAGDTDDTVSTALAAAAQAHPSGRHKLRLLVHADGHADVQVQPLTAATRAASSDPVSGMPALRVALARRPILSALGPDADFVRHKTTRREAYAAFPAPPGCFDVLLWNVRGELTEFTLGNVALMREGRWLTPALAAGLLPGTYRARLLQGGAPDDPSRMQEARLHLHDLLLAEAAAFYNSVRGWLPVDLPALQAQVRALSAG